MLIHFSERPGGQEHLSYPRAIGRLQGLGIHALTFHPITCPISIHAEKKQKCFVVINLFRSTTRGIYANQNFGSREVSEEPKRLLLQASKRNPRHAIPPI